MKYESEIRSGPDEIGEAVIISFACLRRQRGCQARVTSHYVRHKNIEVTLSLAFLVDACIHKSDGGEGAHRYVPGCESVCLSSSGLCRLLGTGVEPLYWHSGTKPPSARAIVHYSAGVPWSSETRGRALIGLSSDSIPRLSLVFAPPRPPSACTGCDARLFNCASAWFRRQNSAFHDIPEL